MILAILAAAAVHTAPNPIPDKKVSESGTTNLAQPVATYEYAEDVTYTRMESTCSALRLAGSIAIAAVAKTAKVVKAEFPTGTLECAVDGSAKWTAVKP